MSFFVTFDDEVLKVKLVFDIFWMVILMQIKSLIDANSILI